MLDLDSKIVTQKIICIEKYLASTIAAMEFKSTCSWDTCENRPKNHQKIIWYYYSYF